MADTPRTSQKTDRRILKTRTAIRNALISLLKHKDLSEITITELARIADIDRKTFYLHYDTVYDVFMEIENEVIHEFMSIEIAKEGSLENYFIRLGNIIANNSEFYKIIADKGSYATLIMECSKTLKQKNLTKETSDTEHLVKMTYIAAGVVTTYLDWVKTGMKIPMKELARSLDILTCGILQR